MKATTPTSVPGSDGRPGRATLAVGRGFTLLELLVVLFIVAVASGVMTLALRDGEAAGLEREAVRLAALLESARADSRVSGQPAAWAPLPPGQAVSSAGEAGPAPDFLFSGLGRSSSPPQRWLDPGQVQARVLAGPDSERDATAQRLWLGPDAVLPPQAVELRRGRHAVRVASDGLGPFAAGAARPIGDAASR